MFDLIRCMLEGRGEGKEKKRRERKRGEKRNRNSEDGLFLMFFPEGGRSGYGF